MIQRCYELETYLKPNRVLVLYGPRRVGKTVLLEQFLTTYSSPYKLVNGDDLSVQEVLSSQSIERITQFVQGYRLLVVDEAQKIPQIGTGLKILVDHVPDIHVIATGSASFDLSNKIGEPLTGRHTTLTLYPISHLELLKQMNAFELQQKREEYLIYGLYPEVITSPSPDEKIRYLVNLVNSYLLRDILDLDKIKASKTILDLLRLIAFQVGSEVSLSELAMQLGIDYKTVGRYLDLLEKSFILIQLRGYKKNLRQEINSKSKYYFYDTGIRNAIISNFNPPSLRDDLGALWENFLIIERLKKQTYQSLISNNYFWRTWEQKEIDLIEEREGKLYGYEFKYKPQQIRLPKAFTLAYPNAEVKGVTSENYMEFIT